MKLITICRFLFASCAPLIVGCAERETRIEHGDIVLEINDRMHTRVSSTTSGAGLMRNAEPSEVLVIEGDSLTDFVLQNVATTDLNDSVGAGKRYVITGSYTKESISIRKILTIKSYNDFPDLLLTQVSYINDAAAVRVKKWINHRYNIVASKHATPLWTFQGSSTAERKDWLLPVRPGFYQKNYMGLNNSDYGGGIPVTDLWRPDQGIAIGHVDMVPRLVSLPVDFTRDSSAVMIGVEFEYDEAKSLAKGDTLSTAATFVLVHHGDYYQGLTKYSALLQKRGMKFAEAEPHAFESSWCAWGYARNFTVQDVLQTLPKVKELGIKWVTIDDGYQQAEGDWDLNPKKFPRGDEMKKMVDAIHANGMKAMIWWAPLAADPGSKILAQHPDIKLLNKDGSPRDITWWDSYYMSPTNTEVVAHTDEVVNLFINEWGFDGLKMDGQHLNAVPADYNTKAEIEYPEKAFEALPDFFKMIYEKSNQLKPGVVIQNCPCGTCMSVYNMPYMNQSVASDPMSSWQIRHKGKTYKAILGRRAYFGDHVELSDRKSDFASSFGIGAVLGTKFTWPKDNTTSGEKNLLTPEREQLWKLWFKLYDQKMLSKETYRGELYDIGYDIPETHVIQKGDTLHYAFYNKEWNGKVTLRGLDNKTYRVRDYVNDVDLGVVRGPQADVKVTFSNALLLEAFLEDN
jgi:alpha-galactosidase